MLELAPTPLPPPVEKAASLSLFLDFLFSVCRDILTTRQKLPPIISLANMIRNNYLVLLCALIVSLNIYLKK